MATSSLTFTDWQNNTNANIMTTAEELLDKLEDTSELLAEIDQKFILTNQEGSEADDQTSSVIQRFHEGVDSARSLVNMLKKEKWRLSKRQMSVELTMGELEEYKRHLKNDVSTLNQTVEALSLRMIQLENELADAQEVRESLEAELEQHRNSLLSANDRNIQLEQHRNSLLSANDRNIQLYTDNEDLKKIVKGLQKSSVKKENEMLQDEVHVLTQENRKLKDMVRDAEAKCPPFMQRKPPAAPVGPRKGDDLAKLRKEFLEELTSLELSQRQNAAKSNGSNSRDSSAASTPTTLLKIPIVNVQADV
ncbi:hypothetical protein ACOMHN_050275 [Nucella lapillus]